MDHSLWLSIGIGFAAGLRSMTAPAGVTWAARLGRLSVGGTPLAILKSIPAVALLTLFAIGELIADKLPSTPKRTAIVPLLARVATGAFSAFAIAMAHGESLGVNCVAGGAGAIVGAFVGYEIRRRIVSALGIKDFVVAICEDLITIALVVFTVTQ